MLGPWGDTLADLILKQSRLGGNPFCGRDLMKVKVHGRGVGEQISYKKLGDMSLGEKQVQIKKGKGEPPPQEFCSYELTLLQRKKANDILTTGKNAILLADSLHMEEQHFTHRWKGKFIFLSITAPMAKKGFSLAAYSQEASSEPFDPIRDELSQFKPHSYMFLSFYPPEM
ncbi:hypothetical protein E5288_WYG001604 [Bos mutus]|uniref:Uncharacterized protein n=1 Tax=Bos mutus TaxID=72004 RepID=A0A6B0SA68_9CETA|nr:hypothetical protein [Bos mutus]